MRTSTQATRALSTSRGAHKLLTDRCSKLVTHSEKRLPTAAVEPAAGRLPHETIRGHRGRAELTDEDDLTIGHHRGTVISHEGREIRPAQDYLVRTRTALPRHDPAIPG